MATFIIALAVLALAHFIYDGILLPSLRFKTRNDLFSVRDEVRNHYIENKGKINQKAFNVVHDGITRTLNKLHLLSPSMLAAAEQEYKHNKEFRKTVDSRSEIIDSCGDELLINSKINANNLLDKAFLSNIGMWMVYLVPFVVVSMIFKGIENFIVSKIKKFANEIISSTQAGFVNLENKQMQLA